MRNELKSHPYLIQGTFYSCAFLVLGAIARYLHLAEGKIWKDQAPPNTNEVQCLTLLTSEALRVTESASQSSWTTSCFVLSSSILLLVFGFNIFSPCLSCWKGVNAQQNRSDMKPADLEGVLLAMEVAGDVGDFSASSDSTAMHWKDVD